MSARTPVAPVGYEPICGPVRCVRTLRDVPGVLTVGDRVMAWWQRFGYVLGNGTVVGFERHIETGWVKVVIDYDYPTDLSMGADGFVRWDYDRTERVRGHLGLGVSA